MAHCTELAVSRMQHTASLHYSAPPNIKKTERLLPLCYFYAEQDSNPSVAARMSAAHDGLTEAIRSVLLDFYRVSEYNRCGL